METLWQDLKYGARQLARSPGVTAVAVLTLALGIGANTAIFSAVNAILLRPLPYKNAEGLIALFAYEMDRNEPRNPASTADFLDWRDQNHVFDLMTAAHPWAPSLTGTGHPDQLHGLKATSRLFVLLGVEPLLGRTFLPKESELGRNWVVVLGHGLWQRRFGSDPTIIGRTLTLDGESYEVIGVMPPHFAFPPFWATDAEFWVPLGFSSEQASNRGGRFLRVFARLKPAVSFAHARAEMATIAQRLRQQYPETNTAVGITVEPLLEPVVSRTRPALLVLLGVAGFVLLIACANVANLLLARAASRNRELAIRAALGASRARLVRQLLTESLLLAVVGGGLGLLHAVWAVDLIVGLTLSYIPRGSEISLDARVFGFALSCSVLAALVFGLAPAWQTAHPNLEESVREGVRYSPGVGRTRLRGALVVAEVALAFMALMGAGLMLQSLARLLRVDPGFSRENILALSVVLAGSKHASPEEQNVFLAELLPRVEGLPGVTAAGLVNHLPIGGDLWQTNFVVEGRPELSLENLPRASYRTISPGYFRAMGSPLLKGRFFTGEDTAQSLPVVIVNQTLARRYWPGQDPVGRRIHRGRQESQSGWLTVVGVVKDVHQESLAEEVRPEIYFPYAQNPVSWYRTTTLVVRSDGDPQRLVSPVSDQVWAIDSDIPVTNARSMEQILSDSVGQPRFSAVVLALLATFALVLAAVGIFGVVAYSVSQRTHEIGIRMALGAQPGDVLRLVLGQGMKWAALGVGLGMLAALGLTQLLASLLFGVTPTDPVTFVAVSALLTVVGLLACYLPARRATRVDPMIALRYE